MVELPLPQMNNRGFSLSFNPTRDSGRDTTAVEMLQVVVKIQATGF